MATVTIPWGDTTGGNIVLTGVGASQLSVSSDTPNTGADREKRITLQTTNPGSKATVVLTIRQAGLLEPLMASDGVLTDNEGSPLYVMRHNYLMASDGVVYDINNEIITVEELIWDN